MFKLFVCYTDEFKRGYNSTLQDIPGGHGRNLDMVIIAKNPYLNINGNTAEHVMVQARNVLSAMTSAVAGGHHMNPTNTNAGG